MAAASLGCQFDLFDELVGGTVPLHLAEVRHLHHDTNSRQGYSGRETKRSVSSDRSNQPEISGII